MGGLSPGLHDLDNVTALSYIDKVVINFRG